MASPLSGVREKGMDSRLAAEGGRGTAHSVHCTWWFWDKDATIRVSTSGLGVNSHCPARLRMEGGGRGGRGGQREGERERESSNFENIDMARAVEEGRACANKYAQFRHLLPSQNEVGTLFLTPCIAPGSFPIPRHFNIFPVNNYRHPPDRCLSGEHFLSTLVPTAEVLLSSKTDPGSF